MTDAPGNVVVLQLRLDPLLQALFEASALSRAKLAAEFAERGIEFADAAKEFLCLDFDNGLAAGADNFAVLLKPTDGFRDLIAAALARDGDVFAVKQAGHGGAPDGLAGLASYAGAGRSGEVEND